MPGCHDAGGFLHRIGGFLRSGGRGRRGARARVRGAPRRRYRRVKTHRVERIPKNQTARRRGRTGQNVGIMRFLPPSCLSRLFCMVGILSIRWISVPDQDGLDTRRSGLTRDQGEHAALMGFLGERGATMRIPQRVLHRAQAVLDGTDPLIKLRIALVVNAAQVA